MKRKRNVNEIKISDWLWLENLFHIVVYLFHTMYIYLFYRVCKKKCRLLFYTIFLPMIKCWDFYTEMRIYKDVVKTIDLDIFVTTLLLFIISRCYIDNIKCEIEKITISNYDSK